MVVVRLLGTIHIFQYNRMKGGLDFIQFESKTCRFCIEVVGKSCASSNHMP